jgi:hypothetical protein
VRKKLDNFRPSAIAFPLHAAQLETFFTGSQPMRNVFLAIGLASALILSACHKKEEAAPAEAAPAPEAAPAEAAPAPEAAPAEAAPAPEAAPAAPAEAPPAQ